MIMFSEKPKSLYNTTIDFVIYKEKTPKISKWKIATSTMALAGGRFIVYRLLVYILPCYNWCLSSILYQYNFSGITFEFFLVFCTGVKLWEKGWSGREDILLKSKLIC